MELKALEEMRAKKIFKLFFLLILNTIAMLAACYYLTKINADGNILGIILLIFLFIYCIIITIPKNFENKAKKKLLPYLLKNIIKEDGEIKWQDSEFEFEESTSGEEIIDNLENEIDKRCTRLNTPDNDIDKYIDYITEHQELEKKETLSQQEESRLKEIQSYIDEEDKKTNEYEKEKYNIRLQILKTIENNNGLNQYSKEDLVKIEYLKEENKRYEESEELTNLLMKNPEELTEEEQSRIEYLQKKSDEYYENLDKETEKYLSNSDRGVCLYRIFNRHITYDDVFYGSYKGIEFITVEGKEEKVFFGTVIRIPLKKEFSNTLLILNKGFNVMPLGGIQGLQTDLHSMKLKTFNKHSVWAQVSNDVSEMLNNKFVEYVNNSNNAFSYMFKENFAYLIMPHKKDLFKLGTLFKKVDNQKQYQKFERDIRMMLNELEKFASSINAE